MDLSLFFLLLSVSPKHHDKVRWLYEEYHDIAVKLARSELWRRSWDNYYNDAEDVVQNAFRRILKYGKKINYEFDEQLIRAYICKVVTNEVIRYMDKNKKHAEALVENLDELGSEYTEEEFFRQLKVNEQQELIAEIIAVMDEKYRSVLTLKYKHLKNPKEIALMLGIKEKTVYTRISRGEAELIKALRKAGATNA